MRRSRAGQTDHAENFPANSMTWLFFSKCSPKKISGKFSQTSLSKKYFRPGQNNRRHPYPIPHAVKPSRITSPKNHFSGNKTPQIRIRYGLYCTTIPERSPVRARMEIRRPLVQVETPGVFCITGGPEDMPDGASHLPSLGALYLHMVTDGEYHLTGVSPVPPFLSFQPTVDRSRKRSALQTSPNKHGLLDRFSCVKS